MINLSIIVPHYNSVRSLKNLLDSISNRDDVEVIVVDDKSDKFVSEYNSLKSDETYKYVKFFANTGDVKGAGVCRNIGLNHAQGKWLLFADADDFFVSGFYDSVSKYFETSNDIVFFPPTSRDNLSGDLSDRHLQYQQLVHKYLGNSDDESVLDLRYKFLVPWSKLYKRSFVADNGIFFDEIIAANDVMFSSRTGYHMTSFHVSDEIIYCVTKGVGTLTKNTNEKVFDSRVGAYIGYCQFLQKNAPGWYINKQKLRSCWFVIKAINYKLGLVKAFCTYKMFLKHNIPFFRVKDLSFSMISKKFVQYKHERKEEKKYSR